MKRRTLMWGLTLALGCSPQMMTMMDAGMDSGVPMPSMLTATDMLTGTIAAKKPTVGYDANSMVGTFLLANTSSGMPFTADINVRFGGAPMVTTYTSSSMGFRCNVTVARGTATADTWIALFGQPPQADKGTCSLTFTSATASATGYDVAGSLSIVADTQGGASSGMVTLTGDLLMSKLGAKREIKQERAARTRMEILQASIELFARRGILATTMNELAKAIKMTPGALYWHFPTKEDLLLAAMEELHRRFIGEFAEVLTSGRKWPAKKQLVTFLERTRTFLRYHPYHGIFFAMLAAESPNNNERIAAALREMLAMYAGVLGSIIKYGQKKKGEFRDDFAPDGFAHAILSAHMGLIVHQQLFSGTVTYDGMCDALDFPMLDGIDRHGARR